MLCNSSFPFLSLLLILLLLLLRLLLLLLKSSHSDRLKVSAAELLFGKMLGLDSSVNGPGSAPGKPVDRRGTVGEKVY